MATVSEQWTSSLLLRGNTLCLGIARDACGEVYRMVVLNLIW
ncbi:hypothetical protein ACKUV4_015475 [Acinetobacter baumannii]